MINKKRIILITLAFTTMLSFTACMNATSTHTHTFKDATCTTPKTCTECLYTEGAPIPHSFSGATCTSPKKCTTCGKTEGTKLEHSTSLGKCSYCNSMQGTSIWSDMSDYYTLAANYINDGVDYFIMYYATSLTLALSTTQTYYSCGADALSEMYDICSKDSELYCLKPLIQNVLDSIPETTTITTNSQLTEYLEENKTLLLNLSTLSEKVIYLSDKLGFD